MDTKLMKRLFTTAAICFIFGGFINLSSHIFELSPERIYLGTEQISMNPTGIHICIDGSDELVPAVFHDDQGYYIRHSGFKPCPNNHTGVSVIGECAHPSCTYYYDTL